MEKRKIVVAVSGASGSIYTKVLFDELQKLNINIVVGVVMSENAKDVWKFELDNESYLNYDFTFYEKNDFFAPFASGSAQYDTMIVCPCSMGTLGRITSGISNDLMSRAADVMLKERRKLILVTRDTPINLIHIKNMETVTLAGGIICPASPSFYSRPQTIYEAAKTVIDRVLSLSNLKSPEYQWGEHN
jgi:4-hydroxy-3-polyprenylbenzoate decarboxylase